MENRIKSLPKESIIDLDVRPVIQAGGEPCTPIFEAVERVPAGGALCLRVTFKPVPLFEALAERGFEHWVESGSGNDWKIWFVRS